MLRGFFALLALVVILMAWSPVMAQDVTPEAPVGDVVDVAPDAGDVAIADNGNSPTWYLLALGVVVFFATFAQYNLERMSGKSMRELSNSVPTHVVTLLLNGGSFLARLTTTDADDKALIDTGKRMGYLPSQLADGSILWVSPASVPISPIVSKSDGVPTVGNIADLAKLGETPNG
jgi:hypothetical protein